jgi:hypothetical protein
VVVEKEAFIVGILVANDAAANAHDGAAAREIERMTETFATLQSPMRLVDFRRSGWCAIINMIIIAADVGVGVVD